MEPHVIEKHTVPRYLLFGLGVALLLVLAMTLSTGKVLAHAGTSDEGITPEVVPQNMDGGPPELECALAGVPDVLTKFDPATSGTQDGVTLTRTSGNTVDWAFDGFVGAVIVKNGVDGSNRYIYSDPTDSDSNLTTPHGMTGAGADIHRDISHVTFCIGEPSEPVNGNDVINDVPPTGGAAPQSPSGPSWMWGLLGVIGGAAMGGFGLNMLSRRQVS